MVGASERTAVTELYRQQNGSVKNNVALYLERRGHDTVMSQNQNQHLVYKGILCHEPRQHLHIHKHGIEKSTWRTRSRNRGDRRELTSSSGQRGSAKCTTTLNSCSKVTTMKQRRYILIGVQVGATVTRSMRQGLHVHRDKHWSGSPQLRVMLARKR